MKPPAAAGHIALVTGGARRVGRALVDALARAGADVVIHHGSSAQEAETAVQEIRALGRRAAAIQADLERPDEAAGLLEASESVGTKTGFERAKRRSVRADRSE